MKKFITTLVALTILAGCTELGIGFDIYLIVVDDGEVEAEMYPLVYDKYAELAEKK